MRARGWAWDQQTKPQITCVAAWHCQDWASTQHCRPPLQSLLFLPCSSPVCLLQPGLVSDSRPWLLALAPASCFQLWLHPLDLTAHAPVHDTESSAHRSPRDPFHCLWWGLEQVLNPLDIHRRSTWELSPQDTAQNPAALQRCVCVHATKPPPQLAVTALSTDALRRRPRLARGRACSTPTLWVDLAMENVVL